jgi:hypothetical protein
MFLLLPINAGDATKHERLIDSEMMLEADRQGLLIIGECLIKIAGFVVHVGDVE